MAIKIFGILIALFTITFTILSLQDPYSLNLQTNALNFKNIEAKNLKAYESNTSTIKAYYKANSWVRYADRDEDNNIHKSETIAIQCKNNIVITDKDKVIIDDLSDIYVIQNEGKIFIGKRENLDEIKELKSLIDK